jgi:hypothetical protein
MFFLVPFFDKHAGDAGFETAGAIVPIAASFANLDCVGDIKRFQHFF